tara:strand:+ start:3616 stop:4692 length:1077 start_codon:yes stop_codon:yes gene_type:complete
MSKEKVQEEGSFKVKKTPKKLSQEKATIIKAKTIEEVEEAKVQEVVEEKPVAKEETTEEKVVSNSPIIEITEEQQEVKEEIKTPERIIEQVQLPENVEKLVDFMKETGGTVEDYVRLNRDYSSIDNDALLTEYYKSTKPHLDSEEINFLLDDKFSYDKELAEDREIRKKKLEYKEEVAKAKSFLEETKSKYYDEIKLRPGVTQDQKEASEFFNRYNKEQEKAEQQHSTFKSQTKEHFNDFKGFEFNLGEKQFRYGVNNANDVADKQSNLTNFVQKFLDGEGNVKDFNGYHKAIFAGENADAIAKHFYEQGKADSVKEVMAKSKNLSSEPRNSASNINVGGLKVRAVGGITSSRLKIKR